MWPFNSDRGACCAFCFGFVCCFVFAKPEGGGSTSNDLTWVHKLYGLSLQSKRWGLLTPYGRALSGELLSQMGDEKEAQTLYGIVKTPDWFELGGDVRLLQSYVNNNLVEQAKFTVMQADLEVGVKAGPLQVVGSVGYQNPMSANATKSPIISRTHYVQLALDEQNSLRLGRFNLAFGINWPDHFMFSKRYLGWDEGSESYRFEWSRLGEQWQSFVAATVGRPESPELRSEQAISTQLTRTVGADVQIGVNAYVGRNELGPRALIAPTLALSLAKGLSVFGEVDFQRMLGGQRGEAFGFVETIRVNYELLKGLHLYAMQEYLDLDLETEGDVKQAYTLGMQWFIRPHVEVAAGIRKQKTNPFMGFMDLGWVVLHYYL